MSIKNIILWTIFYNFECVMASRNVLSSGKAIRKDPTHGKMSKMLKLFEEQMGSWQETRKEKGRQNEEMQKGELTIYALPAPPEE